MSDERRMTHDQQFAVKVSTASASIVVGPSCITCSDEAVPGKVLSVDQDAGLARVVVGDLTAEVDISLVDAIAPDDVLLIHGGVALERLEKAKND